MRRVPILILVGISISCHASAQFLTKYRDKHGRVDQVSYLGESEWLVAQRDPESHLHKLSHLTFVSLNNHEATRAEIAYISKLKGLRDLQMGFLPGGLRLSKDALAEVVNAKSLEYLSICKVGLEEKDLQFLPGLKNLKRLELLGCQLGVAPDVLTDESANAIAATRSLERVVIDGLRLAKGHFTDQFVVALASLPKLEALTIVSCTADPLSDKSLTVIGEKMNLRYLCIESQDFTDAGIAALATAKTLKEVEIRGDKLTAKAVRALVELPNLELLTIIGENQFSYKANHPKQGQ